MNVYIIDDFVEDFMNVLDYLKGWKTYIVGAAMIIVGLYQSNIELVLDGFGLMALRAGVAKVKNV